jgi:hypothetical protein
MATLATFFNTNARRSFGASRNYQTDSVAAERREAVRAQADPCLLRALPNDDIYFYSKKIDNSRVIRQADPKARSECWSVVGSAAVLLLLGASIIAPHVGSILAGYKLEALKQERQSLVNQKRDLDVKEAGLLSPARLNELAAARNLSAPAADQVFHLDAPSVEGNFARIEAPAVSTRDVAAPAPPDVR